MGRDDNSLNEIEHEDKSNWVRDKKNTSRLIIKKGYSHIQEKIKEIRTKFLSGSNQWTT